MSEILVSPEDAHLLTHKWYIGQEGYPQRNVRQADRAISLVRLHQVVAGRVAGMVVDHINGNKLDNRRENLRHCTLSQNFCNTAAPRGPNPTRGVCLGRNKRFRAYISRHGKQRTLGTHGTLEAATAARAAAEKEEFGEYAPAR